MSKEIAIIGAGLAGLAAARRLRAAGRDAVLFDKGRAPGGRLATRRVEPFRFDHGAQYFTARDPAFQAEIAGWQAAGVIAPWTGVITTIGAADRPDDETRFHGLPGMSAIARYLAEPLVIECGSQVTSLLRDDGAWRLFAGDRDLGRFERVLLTAPAPQAVALLSGPAPELAGIAAKAVYAPCWTLMLGLAAPHGLSFSAARLVDPILAWINARDPAALVVQAQPGWSASMVEAPADAVAEQLWPALIARLGRELPVPLVRQAHRWRYAKVIVPLGQAVVTVPGSGLFLAGDYCRGGRIEQAWISGHQAGEALLA